MKTQSCVDATVRCGILRADSERYSMRAQRTFKERLDIWVAVVFATVTPPAAADEFGLFDLLVEGSLSAMSLGPPAGIMLWGVICGTFVHHMLTKRP